MGESDGFGARGRPTATHPIRNFVGRDDALAVLAEALEDAATGSSRIVWIEGEAGIGKSALLRQFLAGVDENRHVMRASGAEDERLLPFGLMAQLDAATGAAGRATGSLVHDDGTTDPLSVGARLIGRFGAIDGLSVVAVDDLHWADADSASALLFALRRIDREALLVVLAARPDPVTSLGEGWERLLRDDDRVRRIALAGLTSAELIQLAAATTGTPLGARGAERLQAHTAGHPMHARALLAELGTATFDTVTGVLPAPRSLATTLVTRVAALPDAAQQLLAALSVIGASASLAVAATVAGLADPLPALDAAMRAGLVERSAEGELRFLHPLIRGAVYNDLSPSRQRALHLAAAEITDGHVAFGHRVAAAIGPDPDLAQELEALALVELSDGLTALAERHFGDAATVWGTAADRDRCLLFAADAVSMRGDLARLRSLRPVVEACADTPQRSYVMATVEFASGRFAAAEALCASAVDGLESTPSAPDGLRARAATGLATVRGVVAGRWEDALAPARAAVALGAGGTARWALAWCLNHLGRTDELRALASLCFDDPRDRWLAALVRLWCDDLVGGVVELEESVRRDDGGGPPPRLLVPALSALSDAEYRLGRWDDAVVHGELAVSLGKSSEQILALQPAHAVASFAHAGRGRFDLAEAHVDAAEELVAAVSSFTGVVYLAIARAVLAQARADAPAMRLAVTDLLAGSGRDRMEQSANWRWRVLVAEATLGVGDLEEAQRWLDDLDTLVAGWQIASPGADAARLRGQLAEAKGDLDAARAAYETGARLDHKLPLPAARLALAHGCLLRRVGDQRAAIAQLRAARQVFAGLGAEPFLAQCDEELALCGLPASPKGGGPLDLTAAELTVAHLVAQGLTNREVAARLYVSAKTVGYHLGHIYAKLGISSRRMLAGQLGDHCLAE